MDKKILKEMADSVRNDAREYDKSFEDMCINLTEDIKDINEVASLIEEGNIKEACQCAEYLDTLVREYINDKAWDFIHQ